MRNARTWFREALGYCGALVLAAASLPLLALVALILRATFVFVAIAGLAVGAVVYCSNGRFRSWTQGVLRGRETHRIPA